MKQYFAKVRETWFRLKPQTVFVALAVVMTALTAGVIIYASFVLVSRVNVATSVELGQKPVMQFDTKGFEKLNLGK